MKINEHIYTLFWVLAISIMMFYTIKTVFAEEKTYTKKEVQQILCDFWVHDAHINAYFWPYTTKYSPCKLKY